MGQPFLGEIRMFGGNFAPVSWAKCDGQPLPISQNDALFALIGTIYGGDGEETFNLPDLRSRVPIHMGTSTLGQTYGIGEMGGTETVTLTVNQTPTHSHVPAASSGGGTSPSPQGRVWAAMGQPGYAPFVASNDPANAAMSPASLSGAGASQPHDNMLPYLAVTFIICLEGAFPPQN